MQRSFSDFQKRRLFFIQGKGGVGKTTVSRALAHFWSSQNHSVLWVQMGDPHAPEVKKLSDNLTEINLNALSCFSQFVEQKIKVKALAKLFVKTRWIQYLVEITPGLSELFILGRIWEFRDQYDRIVVDMPSTGHGLAYFQSVKNFSKLFGGPIQNDALSMISFFADPTKTAHVILALPEEMPLQEGIELKQELQELFPGNHPFFIANRCFPKTELTKVSPRPEEWTSVVAESASDYATRRWFLERSNLELWKQSQIPFWELPHSKQLGSVFQNWEKTS